MLRLIGLMISIGFADSLNPSTIAPAMYLATNERNARSQVTQFTLAVFAVYLIGGLAVALGPGELLLHLVPHPRPGLKYLFEIIGGVVLLLGLRSVPFTFLAITAALGGLGQEFEDAARAHGAQVWMQINHPGRQVFAAMKGEAWAPSAVALDIGKHSALFAQPRAMTEPEIAEVVARFAATARAAEEAGFTGVQIHAAHGYLLSQFLSPLTNRRTDGWGGSLANRARLLLEVTAACAKEIGSGKLGIRLSPVSSHLSVRGCSSRGPAFRRSESERGNRRGSC